MTTKTKTKTIRFRLYGTRFIINTETGMVTVYDRIKTKDIFGDTDTEKKIGTVSLASAAFRLKFGTVGDSTVRPVRTGE